MYFLIYNINTGKIDVTGSGKEYKRLILEPFTKVMITKTIIDPTKQYIDVEYKEVIDRPELDINWNKTTIINDGIDTASCELEAGFNVVIFIPNIFREKLISDGSDIEINSTVISDVIVTIDKFPYKKYQQIIEVILNE